MTGIFPLIDQLALGLYALIGVGVLYYAWRFWAASNELRATYFELERDLARHRRANAIAGFIIALELIVLVAGVQNAVVPFLEQEENLQEIRRQRQGDPDDGIFITATPRPVVEGGLNIDPVPPLGGDDEDILILTPVPTATLVGTIVPNPPAIEGCNDPRAQIQIPANGMRVFQPVTVRGTAYAENFAFAKIEVRGPGTNNIWSVDMDLAQPRQTAADFAQFVPARYQPPGLYEFRLMVFDISGMPVASCKVNIYTEPPTGS